MEPAIETSPRPRRRAAVASPALALLLVAAPAAPVTAGGAPACTAALPAAAPAPGADPRPLCATAPPGRPAPAVDWGRDILATHLDLDLATRTGTATLTFAPSASRAASLAVGDLEILGVRDEHGPLAFRVALSRLDLGVPDDGGPVEITVVYRFHEQSGRRGFCDQGDRAATMLWPYFCGLLFPCHPDPADGAVFSLAVRPAEPAQVAVYPRRIPAEAPSYMPAFAVGEYTYERLGTTARGTEVGVWYLPGGREEALAGTAHLTAVFDFLERTYGPYLFGGAVASVAVAGTGGMEHHPYWHIAESAMGSEGIHAHEAAHGWFGNGVRIRCWEDFVLSEGVTTYLSARALEAVAGPETGAEVWRRYRERLLGSLEDGDAAAWPPGCNRSDILARPLLFSAPYFKGAFFLRAVEERVGRRALDRALAAFYREHAGRAAGMAELLGGIRRDTGFDPGPLAEAWLRRAETPEIEGLVP